MIEIDIQTWIVALQGHDTSVLVSENRLFTQELPKVNGKEEIKPFTG